MITTDAICIKTLLMENKTITFLHIGLNQKLCDEGAVIISEGLRSNHTLTKLWMFSMEGSVVVRFVCGLDNSEVFNWFRPKHCDDILATNLDSVPCAGYAFARTHGHHAHGLPYLCLARDLDRLG